MYSTLRASRCCRVKYEQCVRDIKTEASKKLGVPLDKLQVPGRPRRQRRRRAHRQGHTSSHRACARPRCSCSFRARRCWQTTRRCWTWGCTRVGALAGGHTGGERWTWGCTRVGALAGGHTGGERGSQSPPDAPAPALRRCAPPSPAPPRVWFAGVRPDGGARLLAPRAGHARGQGRHPRLRGLSGARRRRAAPPLHPCRQCYYYSPSHVLYTQSTSSTASRRS